MLSGFWWTAVSDCGQYRPNNRVIDRPLLRLVTEDIEKLTAKHHLNITSSSVSLSNLKTQRAESRRLGLFV